MFKLKKIDKYITNAPKEHLLTVATEGNEPVKKNIPGDSVEEYEYQKEANIHIAEGEILQQKENL